MTLETRAPQMRSASEAARETVRLVGANYPPNTEFPAHQQVPEAEASDRVP